MRTACAVQIARPLPLTDALGAVVEGYSSARLEKAGTVLPEGGGLAWLPPGQVLRETRAVLLAADCDIRPRDGVWLNERSAMPPWRCVRVERYPTHVRAVLERRLNDG